MTSNRLRGECNRLRDECASLASEWCRTPQIATGFRYLKIWPLLRSGELIAKVAAEKEMLSLKFIAVWLPLSYAMPFLSCAQSAPKSGCIDSGAIRGQQTVDWDTVERRCLEEL